MFAARRDQAAAVVDALRKLGTKASAQQVRDHIANLTNYPGVNGVYDFKAVPQRGLTVLNAVVTRWDPAADTWTVVSGLTGTPLQK